jgi:hypothetical protein
MEFNKTEEIFLEQDNNMLETICTDLKTSKTLKELGFNKETNFIWAELGNNKSNLYFNSINLPEDYYHKAYTLEQIIKEIPYKLKIEEDTYFFDLDHNEISYTSCHHLEETKYKFQTEKNFDNIATAAAKFWIKLKEYQYLNTPTKTKLI